MAPFGFRPSRTLAAGLLAGASLAAQAQLLYSAGPTGALDTSAAPAPASFTAAAGPGLLSFQLQGYATLDGDHFWIDVLHVVLNGSEVFSLSFDLGGGGTDRVLLSLSGSSVVKNGALQQVDVSLPISLLAGSNTLSLYYESPLSFEGSGRAGFQGLGDEGWGLNSVAVSAVPEPGRIGLMLGGLGLLLGWRRFGR